MSMILAITLLPMVHQAMISMQAAMGIQLTGNPDTDFCLMMIPTPAKGSGASKKTVTGTDPRLRRSEIIVTQRSEITDV